MRILGIDPGLITTGFGVVDVLKTGTVKIVDAGTINPKIKDVFPARIAKVHQCLTAIIVEHKPEVIVLEKLYAHYNHPNTACILGHVRGVICLAAHEQKVELVEYSVKRIRQALTGNGNSTKLQVQAFIKNLLNIPNATLALDTSDALALALGYAHMKRFKIL